jgi:hypothetical protein
MVASEEASQDFVDFWIENVDSGYVSPYPSTNLRRRMEAFYFNTGTGSLYGRDHTKPAEWDKSFIAMYEKGQTVHSWSVEDLLKSYPLEATAKWQKLQANPRGAAPPTVPSAPSGAAT